MLDVPLVLVSSIVGHVLVLLQMKLKVLLLQHMFLLIQSLITQTGMELLLPIRLKLMEQISL